MASTERGISQDRQTESYGASPAGSYGATSPVGARGEYYWRTALGDRDVHTDSSQSVRLYVTPSAPSFVYVQGSLDAAFSLEQAKEK